MVPTDSGIWHGKKMAPNLWGPVSVTTPQDALPPKAFHTSLGDSGLQIAVLETKGLKPQIL